MYVVIEFLDEGDDLAVLPDSWCSNRSNGLVDVSWPLCRDPSKMNKLVVNKACPMMGWKKHRAKVIGLSRMYCAVF